MSSDLTTPRIVSTEDLDGVTPGQLVEVTTAVTMILSLPQAAAAHVDALAVPTGQGEHWRLTHAIRMWEANPRLRLMLVANGNPAEHTYTGLSLDALRDLGLSRTREVHVQPGPAPNTGRQAAWIAEQVRERGITSLALAVSPYHLPRAYLTVLRELDRRNIRIPVIPAPTAVAPHTPVPETGASAYDLVPGELKRIVMYTADGHVATPQDLARYLDWLWTVHRPLLTGSPTRPSD